MTEKENLNKHLVDNMCRKCGLIVPWINQNTHRCSAHINNQIGGNHYKQFKIQPVEFIHKNTIGFMEGNAIKYLCRYKSKGGIEDLEKAKHYIEMLIEMERENADNG